MAKKKVDGVDVELTLEEKAMLVHEEAATARVAKVTAEIEAERVSREKLEAETGLEEGDGAKADREKAEKERLAKAAVVRTIELVDGSSGNALMDSVIARLNEVIEQVGK